jgi:hypothetical protein
MPYDEEGFKELDETQKTFMKKASDYAVVCRYPYYHQEVGMQVSFIPPNDVDEIVQAANLLFDDLYDYICTISQLTDMIHHHCLVVNKY